MGKKSFYFILIIVVAFLFRYILIGGPSLNGDEGDNMDSVINIIQNDVSPWQRWAGLLPPMSIWTIYLFIHFLGYSEFALRIHGAILGTLVVVCVYLLAKLHFGEKTALISSLFAAILPLLVLSNRDAHPDNVLVFFSLLSILLFEFARKKNSKITCFLGGLSFGLAIISKYNSAMIFVIYWFFVLVYGLVYDKHKSRSFVNNAKHFFIAVFSSILVLFLSFGFDLRNFFYFASGVVFWVFNQNISANMPWYYSFSVLFDGLSPVVFLLLPFAGIIVLLNRNRNHLLNFVLCFGFLFAATLQARKFPRHFLLALPFAAIILGDAFMIIRKQIQKKFLLDLFLSFLIVSCAGFTVYKIVQYQDYVVWSDVGKFVLSVSDNNTSIYVDGVEFWTLKFYTNSTVKLSSKLNQYLLKQGDIVLVHDINISTPFYIGSPLQNDLTLYSSKYVEQYEFNEDFYSFVRKYGVVLKTFKYDDFGNKIIAYKISKFLPKNTVVTSEQHKLDSITQKICNIWNSDSLIKRSISSIMPADLQLVVSQKCSKGCVYTCDFF